MHICRNFSGSYAPFELRILAQIKYTTETVCHRNSSKLLNRILRNFVVDKDKLCTCAHLQEIFIWLFSKRTIRTEWVGPKYTQYYFEHLVWSETGLAGTTEKLFNQISFWQWMSKCYTNETIINQVCVSDYYQYSIMIFCLILPITNAWHCHSLCAALSNNVGALGTMWACSLYPSLIPSVFCYTFFQHWSSYIVDGESPQVLCSLYYQQKINNGGQSKSTPTNVTLVPGPGPEIDIDHSVTIVSTCTCKSKYQD